jgi:hypothetical protein
MDVATVRQFKQLLKDVSEIKDTLLGNEYNKSGIVERLAEIEKTMFDLKILRAKIIGASFVVATAMSAITSVILKFGFNV